MPRHIKFSRTFPAYHPKKGQPTRFIEKYYACMADTKSDFYIPNDANDFWDWHEYYNCKSPKSHTIRSGHRWKKGDYFQPSVWGDDINPKSGRSGAYHSKSINIAPPTLITDVWDFRITKETSSGITFNEVYINNKMFCPLDACFHEIKDLAKNDGLETQDLIHWFIMSPDFKKTNLFDGQIVCWNENVKY